MNTRQHELKKCTFRALSLLLALALVAGLELTFRLAGWGKPNPLHDPFFHATSTPLFRLSPDHTHYQTHNAKLHVFSPQKFPVFKSSDEIRIFCLGGSTVQGRPYSSPTAFPAWLQINLQLAHPDHQWNVINAGGVSYGTQRLIPVLDECLTYQPDLIILCTGHNEFLERQIYDRLPSPAIKVAQAIHGLHLYRALQSFSAPPTPAKSPLPSEVDTLLDHPGGLESFRYDPDWRKHVITTFDQNLNRLVHAAQSSNTPILLVHPPSNLKDCPPFKSDFTAPTTDKQQSRWQSLLDTHRLQEALAIDPQHPLVYYLIGQHHIGTGDTANALKHLTLARDHDTCPLRILSPMEKTLQSVSQQSNIPLVDAQILLAKECTATIPGSKVLVDHVHPSIRGHQLIAEQLLQTVSTTLGLTLTGNWQSRRSALYQTHIDALPPLYFTHGLRRLRAVNAWAEGRVQATQPPRETRPDDTE